MEENETEHTVLENVLGVRPQVDCTNNRHHSGMSWSTNISKLLVKTPRRSSWKSFLALGLLCWVPDVKKAGSDRSEFLTNICTVRSNSQSRRQRFAFPHVY